MSPPGRSFDIGQQASLLISFPLVGFIFGLIAFVAVRAFHPDFFAFTAWGIPVLWFLIAGGAPFRDLAQIVNSLFGNEDASGTKSLFPGFAAVLIIFSGEAFALLEGQKSDSKSLSLIVLLTPVISRYLAMLFGLQSGCFVRSPAKTALPFKIQTIAGSSLITFAITSVALPLGAIFFLISLLSVIGLYTLIARKDSSIPVAAVGAAIPLTELLMIWTGIALSVSGISFSEPFFRF